MLKLFALIIVFVLFPAAFLSVASISSNKNTAESEKSECTWSIGGTFPTADGHNIFPPLGPSLSAYPGAPLWYAGSACTWFTNHSAQTIGMTITIPYSTPRSDEFYYVLLSAWDSAGSYDQIGFSNNYGTWGLTYSWTTGPANNLTFHYTANALAVITGSYIHF